MIMVKLKLGNGYYKPVYVPDKTVVAGPNGLLRAGELLVADKVQGLEVIVATQTYMDDKNEFYAELGSLRHKLWNEYRCIYE